MSKVMFNKVNRNTFVEFSLLKKNENHHEKNSIVGNLFICITK